MRRIHIIRILIIIMVFFDFLFFNFRVGFFNITVLRILILVAMSLIVLKVIRKDLKIPKSKLLIYSCSFFIVWFMYSVIQLFYTQDIETAIKQIYYLLIFIVMIFSFSLDIKNEELKSYISIFTNIGILLIYLGILELITGYHFPQSNYSEEIVLDISRATSVFANENDFGLFLVMIFPLILLSKTKKKLSIMKYITILLLLALLYYNDSKSALIAITIQFIFFILFTKKTAFVKSLLILITSTLIILSINKITDFFAPILIQLNNGYGSAYVRLNVYKNGILALRDSNYLGVGPGNFETSVIMYYETFGIINPHNWWIELATNYGLLIFSLYLLLIILLMIYLLKGFKKNPIQNTVYLPLFLLLIGFSVGNIGPSGTFNYFFVWAFHGLIIGSIYTNKVAEKKNLKKI